MQLSKEIIDNLNSENLTKEIIVAIEQRTNQIIKEIFKEININSEEWCWDFDESTQQEQQFCLGENICHTYVHYLTRYSNDNYVWTNKNGTYINLFSNFPKQWLYLDYKDELVSGINRTKAIQEKEKNRKKTIKKLRKQYIESAKQKLNTEELWALDLVSTMPLSIKQKI